MSVLFYGGLMSRFVTILYQDQTTPTWFIVLLLVMLAVQLVYTTKPTWKDRLWNGGLLVLLLLVLDVRYIIGPSLLALPAH